MAHANDVIDYYLNGAGSYFAAGHRKPLTSDEFGESTIADLTKFKNSVIASQQFADDPGEIMGSIVHLIEETIKHVEAVAQYNEGEDNIRRPLPPMDDRIERPPAIYSRQLNKAPLRTSVPAEQPPPTATPTPIDPRDFGELSSPSRAPSSDDVTKSASYRPVQDATDRSARYLGTYIFDPSGTARLVNRTLIAPGKDASSTHDQASFGNRASSQALPPQADPDFYELSNPQFAPDQTQPKPGQLIGIFSGQPFDPLPSSVFGLPDKPDKPASSGNDIEDMLSRWISRGR